MKLQSVEEFFHKRETVEKYNVDKIIKLNWECPDVLFSFRGVYAIGVFIYYRQLFGDNVKTDIKVKDEKGATRQRLYSDKFLSENYPQFSDVNDLPEIKGFLEHYYDIGNIIPTWPGANINRGMAHCYDIPNVYYKRHDSVRIIMQCAHKNLATSDLLLKSELLRLFYLLASTPGLCTEHTVSTESRMTETLRPVLTYIQKHHSESVTIE